MNKVVGNNVASPLLLPIFLSPDVRVELFVDLDPLVFLSGARGRVLGAYRCAPPLGCSDELFGGVLRRKGFITWWWEAGET